MLTRTSLATAFVFVASQSLVATGQTHELFEPVTLVQAEDNPGLVASPSDDQRQPTPAAKPVPAPAPRVGESTPRPLTVTSAMEVASSCGGCASGCASGASACGCAAPGCACADANCGGNCCCQPCCQPCGAMWTVSGELLFLDRSQPYSGVIVVDDANFPAPATTGDNLNFDPEVGPRITLTRRGAGPDGLELVYFGFHNWSASHVNPGNNDRSIPNPLGLATFDYFAADQITVSYSSEIQNGELMYTYAQNDRLTFLGGLRYLSLDETLNINAVDSDSGTSDYLINARNSLFGGQLGARYRFGDPNSLLNLTVTGKVGVFNNDTKQRSFMRDFNNTLVLRDFTTTDTETSFIGELNFINRMRLCDNLNLLAGYNLIWVENVAMAPQQLDFTDTPTSGSDLRETAGLFLHGASIGLEATF